MPHLIKALRELNIGFASASDFLYKEFGIKINSVNSKISDSHYNSLCSYFNKDKAMLSLIKKKRIARKEKRFINEEELNEYEKNLNAIYGDIQDHIKYNTMEEIMRAKGIYPRTYFNNMSRNARFISVPFGGKKR